MGAIEVVDEVAQVDTDRCIGCGVCVSGCDTDAVELVRREEAPVPPATMREFGIKTLQNKGKLAEFIEINK
jgi:Fe-S-cluster-containing hydrogenase component 2